MKKWIVIMFAVSLAFFMVQHSQCMFWDFTAYTDNAMHILGKTDYFEWMRPPLVPLALSFVMIFGWLGEYFFIFGSLLMFFYASATLAKACRIREDVFIFFMLQPIFFLYGMSEGTEIFSAALFMFFLAFLIEKKSFSGIFLGLGIIARYSMAYFMPLIFFTKKPKDILKNIFLAVIPLLLWMAANYIFTGNLFTSIADSMALNKIFGNHINQHVQWHWITALFGFYFLLSLGGAAHLKRKILQRKHLIFLLLPILILIPYLDYPLKVIRYLFLLIIPLSYFSTIYYAKMKSRIFRSAFMLISIVMVFFTLTSIFPVCSEINRDKMEEISDRIWDMGSRQYMSNAWVHLNYFRIDAVPYPGLESIDHYLSDGRKILILKRMGTDNPDRTFSDYPVIYEDDDMIILGTGDDPKNDLPMDLTYLENRKVWRKLVYGDDLDHNPCTVLFQGDMLNWMCHVINLESPSERWKTEYPRKMKIQLFLGHENIPDAE